MISFKFTIMTPKLNVIETDVLSKKIWQVSLNRSMKFLFYS